MDAVITAFASGKGGSGKSVVSFLCGTALAAQGKKTVLIEVAPALRCLDVMAGVADQAVFDLEDVLSGRVGPGKALVQNPAYPGLSLLLAPYSGGHVQFENITLLCERFSGYYDHILLDVSTGSASTFAAAATVADRLMLVQTPDPASLRGGRLLAETLRQDAGRLRLILNRVDAAQVGEAGAVRDLDEAIDTVGVQLIGVVPESAAIHRVAQAGTPLPAKSLEARVFGAIAQRMCGQAVPLVAG